MRSATGFTYPRCTALSHDARGTGAAGRQGQLPRPDKAPSSGTRLSEARGTPAVATHNSFIALSGDEAPRSDRRWPRPMHDAMCLLTDDAEGLIGAVSGEAAAARHCAHAGMEQLRGAEPAHRRRRAAQRSDGRHAHGTSRRGRHRLGRRALRHAPGPVPGHGRSEPVVPRRPGLPRRQRHRHKEPRTAAGAIRYCRGTQMPNSVPGGRGRAAPHRGLAPDRRRQRRGVGRRRRLHRYA